MDANEYQAKALLTMNDDLNQDLQLQDGIMGLTGEAGECSELLKKHLFQGHKLVPKHLAEELGDVLWYIAISADALGYDLEQIMEMNIRKLKARYPKGFDSNLSVNREK